MKTRNCDECAHFSVIEDGPRLKICAKDHKPRFYAPRSLSQALSIWPDFGWKRRCEDFDAAVSIEIEVTK